MHPHPLRRLKVLIRLNHDTGISEEAREEMARAAEEVGLMRSMQQDFRQLRDRAQHIRERNGFEEMMNRLLEQPRGRTGSHGTANTNSS